MDFLAKKKSKNCKYSDVRPQSFKRGDSLLKDGRLFEGWGLTQGWRLMDIPDGRLFEGELTLKHEIIIYYASPNLYCYPTLCFLYF